MRNFFRNENGNVAVTFALTAITVAAVAGGALDYTRVSNARSEYQQIVDSAALAAAVEYKRNSWAKSKALGEEYFRANLPTETSISIDSFELRLDGDAIVGDLKAKSPNTLLAAVGKENFSFDVRAMIRLPDKPIEVALVLDNTYSMNSGGKLNTLKKTAEEFIETLLADHLADKVKVSIVPFAKYVNVGRGHYGSKWLDAKDKITVVPQQCRTERKVTSKSGCRTVSENQPGHWTGGGCTSAKVVDGVQIAPAKCTEKQWSPAKTVQREQCDNIQYGPEEQICTPRQTYETKWQGCVSSRGGGNDVVDGNYGVRIPGPLRIGCPQEIVALTNNKSKLVQTIRNMKADEDDAYSHRTYIPQGVAWGMRVLSPEAPFTEGLSASDPDAGKLERYLIVMTDGDNTASASYDDEANDPDTGLVNRLEHNDRVAGLHIEQDNGKGANKALAKACDNAKTEGMKVFTITFGGTVSSGTKSLMVDCATSPAEYFDATSNDALLAAFRKIANDIVTVYVAK